MTHSRPRALYNTILQLCGLLLLLTLGAMAEEDDDNPWRAGDRVLCERIERLAANGEVDAAARVLEELLRRPQIARSGLDDRARMALARGYLAANKSTTALRLLEAVSWTDKAPELAADIVALQLAIRWRGVMDAQGILRSAMIPPQDSVDAPRGRPGGPWLERREHWAALQALLDSGLRMVAAEGITVPMPTTKTWLELASYAHGRIDRQQLALSDPALTTLSLEPNWMRQLSRRLGSAMTVPPDLALALIRLHLEEHDIPAAWVAFDQLRHHHPRRPETRDAFTLLRTWQLQRQRLDKTLLFWPYPAIEAGLDGMATVIPTSAATAQEMVDQDQDLLALAREHAVREILAEDMSNIEDEVVQLQPTIDASQLWSVATRYPDLRLIPSQTLVPAGTDLSLRIDSIFTGSHEISLWRLPDHTAFKTLTDDPSAAQDLLGHRPWRRHRVQVQGTLGHKNSQDTDLSDLPEGFYAATMQVRGGPVVPMIGFTVVDPDLDLMATAEQVLAWTVSRRTGAALRHEAVALRLELVRNTQAAAGEAWQDASPAWRAGFAEAFADQVIRAQIHADQEADVEAGRSAGQAARALDPPLTITHRGRSDGDGLLLFDLPPTLVDRAYRVTATIDRPEVMVESRASHGAAAHWTAKAVAWADRPLVRPGDSLHWKALLRSFDGSRLRLPVGSVQATLRCGDTVLAQQDLALADDGTIHGTVVIPPAIDGQTISLQLDDGPRHHLARLHRQAVPEISAEVLDLGPRRQIRAGEPIPLRLLLRDRHGEGLGEVAVTATVTGHDLNDKPLPGWTLENTSDLGGLVLWSIPTLSDQPALYHIALTFSHAGQAYRFDHQVRTRLFPFDCDLELRERSLRAGDTLRLEARFPATAQLHLWLADDDHQRLGEVVVIKGREEGWTSASIPLQTVHVGATRLVVASPVLSGAMPERHLSIEVGPRLRPRAGSATDLVLTPQRRRVDPGEALPVAVAGGAPGATVVLLIGDRVLRHHSAQTISDAATAYNLEVAEDWGPATRLSAVTYVPGHGFSRAEPVTLEVRPIDRLLRLTITTEHDDYQPGDRVRGHIEAVDWQGQRLADISLSLGAIDAMLYQLAEDQTPDLWRFFHDYDRPWTMQIGQTVEITTPQALYWRSVIKRWHTQGMFGSRTGGGRRRAVGRFGGSRASNGDIGPLPLHQPDVERVHWAADLRTDAEGRASFSFTLPDSPGRWRLTARANDASHRVMVGEIRHHISARLPVQARLHAPVQAMAGDDMTLRLALVNRRDEDSTVRVIGVNHDHTITLPALGRREVELPITMPAGDGPLLWHEGVFGHRALFELAITPQIPGAQTRQVRAQSLIRAPGLALSLGQRQSTVIDADRRLELPLRDAHYSAIHLHLQAYSDGGARAREWLATARDGNRGVLRALIQLTGDQQRQALAALWPQLKQDLTGILIAQIAHERGAVVAGGRTRLPGALGDWLLARGRHLGQSLPRPRRSGLDRSPAEHAARAVSARFEQWSEGPQLWQEALKKRHDTPWALAILADAARLLDDPQAPALAEELAVVSWHEPQVAILAVHLLADRAPVAAADLQLDDGLGTIHPLGAQGWRSWTGAVGPTAHLRGPEDTLVVYTLNRLEAPDDRDEPLPVALDWWQPGPLGWHRVEGPVRPGTPVLLRLQPNRTIMGRRHLLGSENISITGRPPLGLRGLEQDQATLVEDIFWTWRIDAQQPPSARDHSLLRDDLQRLSTSDISAQPQIRGPNVTVTALDQDRGIDIRLRHQALFAGIAHHEGRHHWPGLAVEWPDAQGDRHRRVVQPPPLIVRGAPAPTLPPAPESFPHHQRLIAMLPQLSQGERWTLANQTRSAAQWQEALDHLDPEATHSLNALLAHPDISDPGHWSHRSLIAMIDNWPAVISDPNRLRQLLGYDTVQVDDGAGNTHHGPTMWYMFHDKMSLLEVLLDEQDRVDQLLVQALRHIDPQRRRPQQRASFPVIYQALIGADQPLETWLWTQDLPAQHRQARGYGANLEDWAAFLRHELHLDLRLDPQLPVGLHGWPGLGDGQPATLRYAGAALGTAEMLEVGLILIHDDGQAVLRPLRPGPQGVARAGLRISLIGAISPHQAVRHLQLIAGNRGLDSLSLSSELEHAIDAMSPRSLAIDAVSYPEALRLLAQALNQTLRQVDGGWIMGHQ